MKAIYTAETVETPEANLTEFERKWDNKYPPISRSWRRNWERIIPFFDNPPEVRRVIYTTNAIESLPMTLRKVVKNREHFPKDEAAAKLLYLALRNVSKRRIGSVWNWKQTLNQFAIIFEGRMPGSA